MLRRTHSIALAALAFATALSAAAALSASLLVAQPAHALGRTRRAGRGTPATRPPTCCRGRRSPRPPPTRCRSTTRQLVRLPRLHRDHGEHQGGADQGAAAGRPLLAGPLDLRAHPVRAGPRLASPSTRSRPPSRCPRPVGEALDQPQDPPLLQWTGVAGRHRVHRAGRRRRGHDRREELRDQEHLVRRPRPADGRRLVLAVTASKGTGLNSLPVRRRALRRSTALPAPQITYPVDDINQSLEDVVFDWTPVPGAKTYDLQVSTDADFNNIALTVTGIQSTRYSPPDHAEQRPVLVAGPRRRPGRSAERLDRVAERLQPRCGPKRPQAVYPLGDHRLAGRRSTAPRRTSSGRRSSTPRSTSSRCPRTPNFSPSTSVTDTCTTAQTTYTPRNISERLHVPRRGPPSHYWRVRPIDYPYSGGLPGIYSTPQAFTYTRLPPRSAALGPQRPGDRPQDRDRRHGRHHRRQGLRRHLAGRRLRGRADDSRAVVGPGPGCRRLPRLLRPGRQLHHVARSRPSR